MSDDGSDKEKVDAACEEMPENSVESEVKDDEVPVKKRSADRSLSGSRSTDSLAVKPSKAKSKRKKVEESIKTTDGEESEDIKLTKSGTKSNKRVKSTGSSKIDSDESEESRPALLEQELIVEGKRKRTSVNRLLLLAEPKKEVFQVPKGRGKVLDTIPWVSHCISSCSSDDLKLLHRVLFNRAGASREIKKNIRMFSGFAFNKGDDEYNRVRDKISSQKFTMTNLKFFCKILGLDKGGTKEQVVERIMEFLLKPCNTGKKVVKKHRRRSGKSKRTSSTSTKRTRTPKAKKEQQKSEEEKTDRTSIDVADEESGDGDNEDSDDDDDTSKKKHAITTGKKRTSRKTQKAKSVEHYISSSSEEDSKVDKKSSEMALDDTDEQIEKKTAKKPLSDTKDSPETAKAAENAENQAKAKLPPSDDDLRECTKKLLQGVNFEEVTVKSVIAQVFKEFPDFNLVNRKPFIKELIIEMIS